MVFLSKVSIIVSFPPSAPQIETAASWLSMNHRRSEPRKKHQKSPTTSKGGEQELLCNAEI